MTPSILILVLACVVAPEDTATDAADADTDTDTDTDADTDACDTMSSGTDWAWNGACPQMRTPCDIVVDGCSFTIDYDADGGMTMGMPFAGTITGDQVAFEDGDSVGGCSGTLLDADTIEGTCQDGCTFSLER